MSASGPSGPLVFILASHKNVVAIVMEIVKLLQKHGFQDN